MLHISVHTEISIMKKSKAITVKEQSDNPAELLRWVERVAVFWSSQSGLPPITGRIVGWLMIANSPEQSASQLATAIGASRASLTTSTQILTAIGLVHTVRRPGERTVSRDGLALLGQKNPRASRIQAADQVYEWAEKVFATAPPCPSANRKPKDSNH
jgi:hypothetical protein